MEKQRPILLENRMHRDSNAWVTYRLTNGKILKISYPDGYPSDLEQKTIRPEKIRLELQGDAFADAKTFDFLPALQINPTGFLYTETELEPLAKKIKGYVPLLREITELINQ